MGKRGTTHIEIIITFVFFIAAVSFAFYLFNPFKAERLSPDTNYLINNINGFLEEDLYLYNIIINESAIPGGVTQPTIRVNLSMPLDNLNVSIINYSNYPIQAKIADNLTYFTWQSQFGKNIIIKASRAITTANLTYALLTDQSGEYYIASSWQKTKVASQAKAADLIAQYNANYTLLKRLLNTSEKTDFAFNISISNLSAVQEKTALKNIKVRAQSKLLKFITPGGDITVAELSVKTW